MIVNPENIEETKKRITELMKLLKGSSCDTSDMDELKEILEIIGQDPELYKKYNDIYDDAADRLIYAGVDSASCKCDPLRNRIPRDKPAH
ncbi:MAG: hypothetical protein ACTSPY_00090 [Candidatus Helarchaeota archaeon]